MARLALELGGLIVVGAVLGLALAAGQAFFGWPRAYVQWSLLAVGLAVLAYAIYAAVQYYRALLEEDEDF